MAEQIEQALSLSSDFGQPLSGIPFLENGHEVMRSFSNEAAADAAIREQAIQQAVSLAGSWHDLDWDEMEAALERIRNVCPPTRHAMKRYLFNTGPLGAYLQGRQPAVDLIVLWIRRREAATSILVYGKIIKYIKSLHDYPARYLVQTQER